MHLETPRLILRNLKGTDLQAYLQFRNSEFVLRYNAMARQSTEEAEEYIRNNLTNDRHVAIARKDTDAFVGMIYVEQDSLRYKALVQHLLSRDDVNSVTARVFADNPGSGKLLRRLGFLQEGRLHQAVLGYDGILHDDLLFSLRKEG